MTEKKTTRNNGQFVKGNKEGNRFTKDNQPDSEAKKKGWVKKRTVEEYAAKIVQETFGQICEKLENGDFTNKELIEVFRQAVDMSGQKLHNQELKLSDNLEIKVIIKDN